MLYFIRKSRLTGFWTINRQHDGFHTLIADHYRSRKAALIAARLLAGWSGKVEVR